LRLSTSNLSRTTNYRALHIPFRVMSTISQAIKTDHAELKQYYKNFCNADNESRRVEWRNQFVWELARHSIGEELVVYPAFEKHLGSKGHDMAETDRKEHQTVKELLYELQNHSLTDPEAPAARALFDALMKDLTQHIDHEETQDLVALENALDKDDSHSMAKSFERTKEFVPTRSHPSAPSKPPFETVVGLMTAPIDKLRDMFMRFPAETGKK